MSFLDLYYLFKQRARLSYGGKKDFWLKHVTYMFSYVFSGSYV